jgi:hypothetical protein
MHDAPHAASRFIFQERYAMVDSIKLDNLDSMKNVGQALIKQHDLINKMIDGNGGTIQIGNKDYRVTIGKTDGKHTVTFGDTWSDFSDDKRDKLGLLLEHRLNGTQGILSRTIQPINVISLPERADFVKQLTEKSSPAAAYGFNDVRLRSRLEHVHSADMKMTTINDLNRKIGVKFPVFPKRVDGGDNNDVAYSNMLKNLNPTNNVYNPSNKWLKMLDGEIKEHRDRFDMFERITLLTQISEGQNPQGATEGMKAKLDASSLDERIGDLLRKNSEYLNQDIKELGKDSPAGKQLLADAVKHAKYVASTMKTAEERIGYLENIHRHPCNTYLRQASAMHYFRNNSKLGLEFFEQQGTKVALWLQNLNKETIRDTTILQHTDRDKRYASGYSEAISFSEMRHAMRMIAKGNGTHIHFVTSATIPSTSAATSSDDRKHMHRDDAVTTISATSSLPPT